jgi:hypothetical protein
MLLTYHDYICIANLSGILDVSIFLRVPQEVKFLQIMIRTAKVNSATIRFKQVTITKKIIHQQPKSAPHQNHHFKFNSKNSGRNPNIQKNAELGHHFPHSRKASHMQGGVHS